MDSNSKYEDRVQREFDKLYTTYEDGVELAPGLFPISQFFANRMAKVAFKEDLGELNNKKLHFNYQELDGVEVAFGVTIVKTGRKYYLDYQYDAAMEEFLEYWLNMA